MGSFKPGNTATRSCRFVRRSNGSREVVWKRSLRDGRSAREGSGLLRAGGVRRLRGFLSGVAGGGGPGRSEVEDRAAAIREIEQKLVDHPV
jgi:hypothetical protein